MYKQRAVGVYKWKRNTKGELKKNKKNKLTKKIKGNVPSQMLGDIAWQTTWYATSEMSKRLSWICKLYYVGRYVCVCVCIWIYIFRIDLHYTQCQSNTQAFSFCLPELKEAYNNNNNNNNSEGASYEYLYKILFKERVQRGIIFLCIQLYIHIFY